MSALYSRLYYSQKWRELHEDIDAGRSMLFTHKDQNGKIVYPLVIRPIEMEIDNAKYYDIATPKGYSGPTILHSAENKKSNLLKAYKNSFALFCKKNNIVCEFVRFNPWLKNHEYFNDDYESTYLGQVFGMDLSVNDIFIDEITSRVRRNIRKAKKLGVELKYDFVGTSLNEFHKMYQYTIEKNNITEYYQLSIDQFKKYFKELMGRVFLLNAYFEGRVITSCLFTEDGEFIHYNYSASDPEFYYLQANSLIIYEACIKGKNDKKKLMDLGGANNDNLRKFKTGFSKKGTAFDCYIGKRIRDEVVYDKLVNKLGKHNNYFPEYRDEIGR